MLQKERIRLLAVVPDPDDRFPCARQGQVGLLEGWNLAKQVRDAIQADERAEKRAIIAVPSHCALLKTVADELIRRMAKIEFKRPQVIYMSNRRARALRDPEGIREDLATNIEYAVRWYDATTVAYERGIRLFVELPPGRTLTDLASAAFPDARSIAFGQTPINTLVKLIKRQAGRG
jgi:malonate decarboxylase epsilon subunit